MSAALRDLVSPATTAPVVQEGQRGVIGDESTFPRRWRPSPSAADDLVEAWA